MSFTPHREMVNRYRFSLSKDSSGREPALRPIWEPASPSRNSELLADVCHNQVRLLQDRSSNGMAQKLPP